MHSLATFIVEEPWHAEEILRRFREQWDESTWGYWDWWSHGGRWAEALEEAGCAADENGYFVLPLDKAREWSTPIVVTPFGHVFDSGQLTYEVSRSAAWDEVRNSIFDHVSSHWKKCVAVMVDVHS